MKEVGGVFSYEIIGGRRITIIADPVLYEIIFSPDEMGMTPGVGDAVKIEVEKLAHAWFGIPKGICAFTRPSLSSVRKAIGPQNVTGLANQVGAGVQKIFNGMGDSGIVDLVQIAHGTFWPVNQAMFGDMTIGPDITPGADDWFHQFDEYVPQVTGGMPAAMFEEMQEAATKIVDMFEKSISAGNHLNHDKCPVLHDRFVAFDSNQFDSLEKAKFMISLFWAPQANTLPMTWWVLVHILSDPRVKKKVEDEVRNGQFKHAPYNGNEYPAEDDDLPYTRACMKEVLRMYIANLTHRHTSRDIPVKTSEGVWYRIPKKDMLSVASYTRHYDDAIYKDPHKFYPERWFEEKHGVNDFWPFALGKWSCSGKFLAMLEIPILTALFFRDFDTELVDPVPAADWEKVVASVRPQGWPYNTNCRVKFTRRLVSKESVAFKASSL